MTTEEIKNLLDSRQNIINENNKLKLRISRLIYHYEKIILINELDLKHSSLDNDLLISKELETNKRALNNIKRLIE